MNRTTCFASDGQRLIALPVLLMALIVMIGTAGPALAATSITTCGFVISSPGNYTLDADLTACPLDGIKVTASGVSISLNGHSITGVARCCFAGIAINRPSPTNFFSGIRLNHVAVQGPGLIQTFGAGVEMVGTDYAQVALVTTAHNLDGIEAFDCSFLTLGSNVAVANSLYGLSLGAVSNSVVQYNDASGNSTGIFLGGFNGANSFANTLNNNTVNANGYGNSSSGLGNGIEVAAGSTTSRIVANVTNGNTLAGIVIDQGATGNQVFHNSSSAGNVTFDLQDGNAACSSDFWSDNVFFTRSQACIH